MFSHRNAAHSPVMLSLYDVIFIDGVRFRVMVISGVVREGQGGHVHPQSRG